MAGLADPAPPIPHAAQLDPAGGPQVILACMHVGVRGSADASCGVRFEDGACSPVRTEINTLQGHSSIAFMLHGVPGAPQFGSGLHACRMC